MLDAGVERDSTCQLTRAEILPDSRVVRGSGFYLRGMPEPRDADFKRMRLRYAGVCMICATELPTRTEAIYERHTKTVRCVDHDGAHPAWVC